MNIYLDLNGTANSKKTAYKPKTTEVSNIFYVYEC